MRCDGFIGSETGAIGSRWSWSLIPLAATLSVPSPMPRRDPIIIGVRVQAGILRVGTPLVVMTKDDCDLGNVGSIEFNHKPIERATKVPHPNCHDRTRNP